MVRLDKGGERVNSAKSVRELAERLKKEETNLSSAVWQTSLACVGYPYVYAAWKYQDCTPSNRKSRNGGSTTPSKEHPTIITACQYLNGTKNTCKGCKWYPNDERVWMFDCRGFTHDMLALFGIQLSGQGCTTQWNTASNWKAKGTIDTIPDDILVCLFYPNKNNPQKMEHTGFGFRGETVECSSGVQHFTKRKAKWTHWAIPVGIDGDIPDYRPTLKRGSTGEYVTLLQTKLINKGYDLGSWGADGKFGAKTEEAVKAFQKDWGLELHREHCILYISRI